MNDSTIAARYESGVGTRSAIVDRAQRLAALTKPWVLPPDGQSADNKLPENYQSIGSRGVSSLVGKKLIAIWTPGTPWSYHKPASAILYDPQVPDQWKRQLQTILLGRDMQIMATLESHNLGQTRGPRASFRSRKRATLDQLVITGDTLERQHEDFRIQLFRRDQYTTKRDSCGDVLEHVTCEEIDPLSLGKEVCVQCEVEPELMEKPASDRMMKLYTWVEWQPLTERWVIRQELNKVTFVESEETVTPYFSTAYNLVPGENYGRSIVEENYGDLRSLDELERRRLELLGLVANGKIVKDENSMMRDSDLDEDSGKVIHGRVKDGKCQDVALLAFDGIREYNMLTDGIRDKSANLGRAFLLESAAQPEGERVTATQIRRIAQEIDSALGGAFAPIAEQQQLPLLARTIHLLEKKGLMPKLPEKAVDVEVVTGITALNRDIQFTKGVELATMMAQFPEQAHNRIDWSIFAEKLFQLRAFYEPGIVKSDEQIQREAQAALRQAMAAKAGEQAIESTGAIAEQQAQPQTQPQGG